MRRHGFKQQGAVEEVVTPLATGLGNQQTAVAGGPEKGPLICSGARLMVGT